MTDRDAGPKGKCFTDKRLHNDPQTVHMNDGRLGHQHQTGPSAILCALCGSKLWEFEPQRAQRIAEGADLNDRRRAKINALSGQIIDAAMKVHSELGPGLLESAYEACLAHELRKRGLEIATQVTLPVVYDGVRLDTGYRIDLLVADQVVVELKTVSKLLPIHEAQLLSHLRLGGHRLGLLINFHTLHLRDGIRRFANGL